MGAAEGDGRCVECESTIVTSLTTVPWKDFICKRFPSINFVFHWGKLSGMQHVNLINTTGIPCFLTLAGDVTDEGE